MESESSLRMQQNGKVIVRVGEQKNRKNLRNKSSFREKKDGTTWSVVVRHNGMHREIPLFAIIQDYGTYKKQSM
jgi:hypothetical protein